MTISAVLLRVIVEAVERAGASREALFAETGIDGRRLEQVEGRFDLREFAAIQTRALDLTGDEALGLHIAEQATEGSFDLVAHLVAHAPTLREALGLCAQFQRLLIDESQVTLRESGTTASLHYEFARSHPRSDRMQVEFVVAALLRLVRTFAGPRGVARAVSFEHARPAHHREYARVFGGAERFGQDENVLVFDREVLDRSQLHQHPALYSMLRAEAERALERVTVGASLSDQLKQYLLARPPSRLPSLVTAARDLGISGRSLRRRLATEGTSYRSLVRVTLEASAGHMLKDPSRSIQETAHALGFSDAGAFHRAFKRWTGMTPKQYRELGARPERAEERGRADRVG